ncbi:dihydroxyacetone kinase subunit DhaK, partial [Methylorubrum extorquens]
APLAEVAALARRTAAAVRTLGIAVSTATIPGSKPEPRLHEGEAELGLGIHGEPGIERIDLPRADALAERMAARFPAPIAGADRLALLVNNLGSTTALEMAVLTKAVLATDLGRRVRLLLGPSPVMTALDMHGASLSFLALDDVLEAALLSETPVTAWPRARILRESIVRPLPEGVAGGPAPAPSRDAVV